ncbi:MAG: fumarylacetoacetate hydrolase family protein [Thermoplasmatales archaeon]
MKITRGIVNGNETSLIVKGREYIAIDDSTFFDINEKSVIDQPIIRPEQVEENLVPVPHIPSIRDFYTFEDHVRKARARRGLDVPKEWYEVPAYYYSGTSMLFTSGQKIKYPSFTSELDYEMEVGAVIGKDGENISKDDAISYIFGFVLANDWSARDIQRKEMNIGLGPSKSKDFATSLGPYVVTRDEFIDRMLPDGKLDIKIEAYVNGRRYSSGNLREMRWSFQELIEYASNSTILRRGDIILSGTVSTGCILELGPENLGWLKKGDVVSIVSDKLGELVNEVI